MNLNKLRDEAYQAACEHGFHDKEYSNAHLMMLVITELCEAIEADREAEYCLLSKLDKENINSDDSGFKKEYETFIKDTVDSELADAVIRLLDLAGLRGIDLSIINQDNLEKFEGYSFTEMIYNITNLPFRVKYIGRLPYLRIAITDMISDIFSLSKYLDIDLMWHIEQKMKYNKLRDNKHGKRY